ITEGFDPEKIGGVNKWVKDLIGGLKESYRFKLVNIVSKSVRGKVSFLEEDDYVELNPFDDSMDNSRCKLRLEKILKIHDGMGVRDLFSEPLRELLSSEIPEADVYHASNSGLAGFVGFLGKIKNKRPLILSEHGSYFKEWYLRLNERFFPNEVEYPKFLKNIKLDKLSVMRTVKNLCKTVMKNSDLVLPVTHAHVPMELRFGTTPDKVTVVKNYVEEHRLSWKSDKSDSVKVCFLGRIDPIKGIDYLIRSAKKVIESDGRFEFHIVGPLDNYDYYTYCETLLEDLSLDGKVIFEGPTKKPLDVLSEMDLFVLPSLSEGLSFSLIEAASLGMRIVATDVGGNGEVVKNFGELIPPKSEEMLSKAIVKSLRIKERKLIVEREVTMKSFSRVNFLKKMDEIYRSVLNS
ncbi:MAG: GT4 family glycosyltransferase PelF, partial [Candidatus Asgardarchaeia archaeon]